LILAFRDKDTTMKQTASGALIAGLFGGISEPSLYGIHLRFKRIYPRMLIGCFVGGITIGLLSTFFTEGDVRGVTTNAFAFTSLLTIPVFNPMWIYAISVAVSFTVALFAVLISDYRTPEEKAAARRAAEPAEAAVEPRVIVVGDVETNQAKQWVTALGGEDNVRSIEAIAETRVRVEVADDSKVDADALKRAGLAAAVKVGDGVWHLVAGLEAAQYAEGMRRRVASSVS
jgi:pts system mannose-specific eiibca component